MILAGDIGGTKSLFGLYDGTRCLVQRRLTNADFADFDEALAAFFSDHVGHAIAGACFALAGPVAAGQRRARLTNLPWTLDADRVCSRHGISQLVLTNDFVAAAMGAVTSSPDQYTSIQAGQPLAAEPCLVLGAGTGLGVAVALPQPQPQPHLNEPAWRIVGGEGGHMGFSPADETQTALMQFLRQRYGRVTWERVVSGPGLADIHQFLGADPQTPAEIGESALRTPDSTAARALAIFLSAYGAFAGDLALTTLPRGGVYLAGGIAAKVLPLLLPPDGSFLAAFGAKAEHATLMPTIPVRVVTDPAVGLRGAALIAQAKLDLRQ